MIYLSYIISFALLTTAVAFSAQSRSKIKIPTRSIKVVDDGEENDISSDRRKVLSQIAVLSSTLIPQSANAEEDIITQLQNSLEERSINNSLAAPSYGLEISDIFYPSSFQGSWNALSKTADIIAPCGFQLFTGGESGYNNAVQSEIKDHNDLIYKARFISGQEENTCVADREYNAKEIAKAAMGDYSVIDTPVATPNRYSCLLAPPSNSGTDNLISVDILAIKRKAEAITTPEKFVCSEYVRQVVTPSQRGNPNAQIPPLSVKEIETISIYKIVSKDKIECRQRTATFLVPSQTDQISFQKWSISKGRPVDVRYYDVTYTRA